MNKARLEKLIIALDGVKPNQFNMNSITHDCGTPACVLGHFAARTDLQRFVRLIPPRDPEDMDMTGLSLMDGTRIGYADKRIRNYFGIDYGQLEYLFGADWSDMRTTPKRAQKRIRKFIDSNGQPE